MSKKFLIVSAVVVLAGVASGYLVLRSRLGNTLSEVRPLANQVSQSGQVKGDLMYTDDSGFSFSYPKELTVQDITPEDGNYYTLLTLSRGEEKITITVKGTEAKTLGEWLKGDTAYSGPELVGATSLGGISAKEYKNSTKLVTVAIGQGVLYLIDGPNSQNFWEEAKNVIVGSFAFAGQKATTGSNDDTTYENEEVVE